MAKLEEIQKSLGMKALKLKQDVSTRWNSTFEMLDCIYKNKEAVISALAICNPKLLLENDDWKIIKEAIELLQIFSEVTEEVSSEKNISLSKTSVLARGLVRCTRHSLSTQGLSEVVELLGDKLLESLSHRFGNRERNDLVSQSIFLDPRFKKQGFGEESQFVNTKKLIIQKIQAVVRTEPQSRAEISINLPSTSKIWQEFDESVCIMRAVQDPKASAIVEVDKYIAEPLVDRRTDPMVWWNDRKSLFPNLYNLALKILCIPATSVPRERIFSKWGQICATIIVRLSSSSKGCPGLRDYLK
ncbi:zinc finger BED domain-containing protein 1-like [Cimex lectularius]|uniref:HAT C-terminal dimerisation domain-containing protein n=1 Tax=Cimex lectularius TaxID=79782 RepID=A0A8I6SL46_CIMLE|nr:zinc finger BED domain-containing protein 1-like [Cimex lectularius]